MTYKITLVTSGVSTDVTATASEASVKTITEGLDSLDAYVAWHLGDFREDPAYDALKYTWPGSMSRLQIRREDTDALVFDGQVYAVSADRAGDEFTISAQT